MKIEDKFKRLQKKSNAAVLGIVLLSSTLLGAQMLSIDAQLQTPPPLRFSQPINSIFPDAESITCLQGHFDSATPTHFWFYKSKVDGRVTIDVRAVAVNPTGESGSVIATLFDTSTTPSTFIGFVRVPHPTGTGANPGDENTGSITIPSAVAGNIYRLEIQLGGPTVQGTVQAHHYKVTSSGSIFSVGVNSPTHRYSEHFGQNEPEVFQVNVNRGENFALRIFTESPDFGAPQATSVTVKIRDRSTLATLFGPTTFTLGSAPASQLITLASPFPNNPGQLVLDITADGHYRMSNERSSDNGVYYDKCPPRAPPPPRIQPVFIDIKPQSCPNPLNVDKRGVLPVAILGTPDFDVTNVDVNTVRLEGVSPLRSSLEDVAAPFLGPFSEPPEANDCTTAGSDGFTDLTLKFDSRAVANALGPVNDGDVLLLRLTGSLVNGTPIQGIDVVIIKK